MLNVKSHQIHLGLDGSLRVAFGQSKHQKEPMRRLCAVRWCLAPTAMELQKFAEEWQITTPHTSFREFFCQKEFEAVLK
jgi:hypothetical protein